MDKLLLAFGLVILFVAFPYTAQSEFQCDDPSEFNDYDEKCDGSSSTEDGSSSTEDGSSGSSSTEDSSSVDDSAIGVGIRGGFRQFVETDGSEKKCTYHSDCYDRREPQAWCRPTEDQSWTDKGCFCDDELHSCIIERMNAGKLEYAECTPVIDWDCP